MTKGVIYYNIGQSCAVRLLISILSLKKFYNGDITIISEGDESHILCDKIASATNAYVKKIKFDITDKENYPYLAKTRLNEVTPYDYSVFVDADTLITGTIDELFTDSPFVVTRMSEWSTNGSKIYRRIKNWNKICPDLVEKALVYGYAINTGIFAFDKNAPIFNEWYSLTLKNRESFIPDEISCQLLITKYQHKLMDCRFNYSCKYGPLIDDIRIIHFHGRKHCRPGLPFNGHKWIEFYNKVVESNIADIKAWQPAGDRMLRKHLERSRQIH